MSIIIKGLDMPSNGAERCIVIRSDGTVRTFVGAEIPATDEQLPPHGRLIDADKLKEAFSKVWKDNQFYETITAEVVDTAPTIIEAEGEE